MSRRVIIILLAILIPIIIGTVAFFGYRLGWFKSSAPAELKEIMYSVGDYTVNLDDPSYKRYMKVTIFIASDYKKLDGELTEKMPRVRDTIIGILRSKKIDDVNTSAKTDAVKREIKEKLNAIFTTGKLTNVYMNDIIIQ